MKRRLKTALARGLHTFARLAAAPLAAATLVTWASAEAAKLGGTKLSVGLIAAGLGGFAAFLVGLSPKAPSTPGGKALAEFLEGAGAGIAVVGFADLSGAAVIALGQQLLGIVGSAAVAAALCHVTNHAEAGAAGEASGSVAPPA